MPYWDERVETTAKGYPDVAWNKFHIDTEVSALSVFGVL
jgi:isocitrate/isopropylmalate dehydrogenase